MTATTPHEIGNPRRRRRRPVHSGRIGALAMAVVAMVGLLVAGPAAAVSLGDISVRSGLNDTLEASVVLRGLAPGELEEMSVALAPEDAFTRAGIERSYLLTRLEFSKVAAGERGGSVLITSKDHIREPSLSFILEVTSKGRVVQRRYDVLLNLR